MFCILVSILFGLFIPFFNLIPLSYSFLIGIPLLIFGIYIVLHTYSIFKNNNTPESFKESVCVVDEGIYRYSRNPMYLGFLIALIGVSFISRNILSFISPIFFFLVVQFMFIPFEEEKMKKEVGKKYLEYKEKVRKWI